MTRQLTLLEEIDAFCAAVEMTPTEFGKSALGDTAFVHQLRRDGREPRRKTVERVRAFMHQRMALRQLESNSENGLPPNDHSDSNSARSAKSSPASEGGMSAAAQGEGSDIGGG